MEKFVLPALIANSSGLGVHWIYDHKYLLSLSKKQSLLFMKQVKEHFDKAKPSFYLYPHAEIGDVSLQGHILIWLYKALKENPDFTPKDYSQLLYNKFKAGGDYIGYLESYAKEQVFNHLIKELRQDIQPIKAMDHQLVGFVPYLVCKELGYSNDKAFDFTKLYSQDTIYLDFFKFFDTLLKLMAKIGMKQAIEELVSDSPKDFKEAFIKAIEIKDANDFISDYAGRACSIYHALPVIIHLLYHTKSYEEAIKASALIGGAVSDRNMLLGALWAQVSNLPEEWKDKLTVL